jgi:hypothetical protein
MFIRRPISRQQWKLARRSVSVIGRQPKRAFQRIGSSTNVESTYTKSSFEISKRLWIRFICRSARFPVSLS